MTDSSRPQQPAPPASPTIAANTGRRRLVLGAAAAGAGLAGACLAWCQAQPGGGVGGAAGAKLSAAELAFWALELEVPQGGTLKLASLRGTPLLVNFWATWCPPCIEELPMLDQFYKEHAGSGQKWQVLGLAVDKTPAVRNFLQKTPLSFPIGITGSAGIEICQSLGNSGGALPFSVVMGSGGGAIRRKMGKVTAQDLKDWAA